MAGLDDPERVRAQYADSANLDARIEIHRRFSTNPTGWPRWVFDQLDLRSRTSLLEVGCGPATMWAAHAALLPERCEVVLTDLSSGMIERARRVLGEAADRFELRVADAQDLPFDDRMFDAVVANHMLYHVPDRPRTIAELHRVLKPGGSIFAATNGPRHMAELKALVGGFDDRIDFFQTSDHVHFGLANGAEQLVPPFAAATLHRYEDALVVTEAEPLVAYVLSTQTNAGSLLQGPALAAFYGRVQREIDEHGAVRITKDAGLFKATKSPS